MNDTLEGINSRITEGKTEWWKSMLQNRIKKKEWNEDSLRDLWDNIKNTNIFIIGALEGQKREDLRKYLNI